MHQAEQARGSGGAERKRVEPVVESLATLRGEGETLAEVAHDARNMVTALGLYCDLLEEPGVLTAPFLHYGNELRLVAAASRRLVEKLVALDSGSMVGAGFSQAALRIPAKPSIETSMGNSREKNRLEMGGLKPMRPNPKQRWDPMPGGPIDDLAQELEATRNLLAALAGPSITLTVDAEGGARAVWMTGEDLTRVLVNLVKNAAEAMPAGGRIQLGLREVVAEAGAPPRLTLSIEDNGPGIPPQALEHIFDSGYTTHSRGSSDMGAWPASHRGLGLSITRSVIEGAGGRILAVNRSQPGARFEIKLPVRTP